VRTLIPAHEFAPRRGGIATYLGALADVASGSGETVEVWAPRSSRKLAFPYHLRGNLFGNQNAWSIAWTRFLLRFRDEPWSDTRLILGEPGPLRAWLGLSPRARPRPRELVLLFHGSELGYWAARPERKRRLAEALLEVRRVCVVSEFVKELFLAAFPSYCGPVEVVPGFLSPDFPLFELPPGRGQLTDQRKILTVGRVHPRKGQRVVVEALGRLPEVWRRRICFQFAGPVRRRTYFRKLKARAEELGVIVEYLGVPPEKELLKHYAEADIFTLASGPAGNSVEGLGLVLLEAAAFALPRVVTDHGGMREVVEDGVTGRVVPTGDLAALAGVFQELLENPFAARRFGEAGREALQQRPGWNEIWKRISGC